MPEPAGCAAPNGPVTFQTAVIAHADNLRLIMFAAIAVVPFVLLMRRAQDGGARR